jgi:hypothetical protein
MLGEYYEYRGWSEDGIPSKEKLEELEIRPSILIRSGSASSFWSMPRWIT